MFGPFLLWPKGWLHHDVTWYASRPRPWRLCVTLGTQPPSPKKWRELPPIFSPCLLWSNGCMDQDATWYGGRPWPRRHCANGDPASPPQKVVELPSQFSAHVYCGQTAGWIKMTLGMELGLVPGHIVLGGNAAALPPQKKGVEPSQIFGPSLLRPKGWMHQDATWYGGRPQPTRLCVRWGPSPLPKRGRSPHFSAHVCCGQTAVCILMIPLDTGVGLSLGVIYIVLDGHPAPLP